MNKKDRLSRQVIVVLVIAGILIFVDSFSWSKGGMNGIGAMIVAFLAVIILGSMFLGRILGSLFQPKAEISQSNKTQNSSVAEKFRSQILKRAGLIIFIILIIVCLLIPWFSSP